MSERNENELNDKNGVTNQEIENELEKEVVVDHEQEGIELEKNEGTIVEDVPGQAVTSVTPTAPAAPEKKASANFVPWVITVIAVAALVFVLVRNPSGGNMNEVVGKMDGITIKKSDLYDSVVKQMGDEQLTALVDSTAEQQLIDTESEKAGVVVTDADVQLEIKALMKQYGMATDADLEAALQQSGMTLADFKEKQVKPQLKYKKLFEKQHPASEDDLKAYFEKNKETTFATTPKEVRASHILLPTKEEAEAVLAELKAGKDFATLAKEKSQDPGSKDKGGDLDFFKPGMMNEGFETAAFALAKGEMSGVVEAESGFHIIKVTDIKPAVVPAYDEVKDLVSSTYFSEKFATEGQAWIEKMKTDRNYENLLVKEPEPAASATPPASPEASPAAQ
ncbi:peptidylprolyl isomerase [Cohnella lupini]|uniref:Foldase protein PrsA n=1 Tax=Cohnella lupini TaxID=1294267 RepID=A0A3D9IIW1_9BACL|nr:peptidylprolyl isomerase [Cohnella lupini]RED61631.1 foldase protein PrsA [Cohnella lupini]